MMKTNNYSDINKEETIVKKRKGEKIEIMAKKKKMRGIQFFRTIKEEKILLLYSGHGFTG